MNDLNCRDRVGRRARAAIGGFLLLGLLRLAPACQSPPPPGETGEAAPVEVPGGEEPARLDPAAIVPGPPIRVGEAFLFTLVEPDAKSVTVVGTFNGWIPTANPLERSGDLWYALVEVPYGKHKYRFLVDGTRWELDPDNERRAKDSLGNLTSALNVRQ